MKNVILTNLSTLNDKAVPGKYYSDLGEIEGTQTNDAPIRYLLKFLDKQTNKDFVVSPIKAIQEKLYEEYEQNIDSSNRNRFLFRPIISGGDEITLVCNARAVPLILETYFDTLKQSGNNTACAGVAIFHSHAPFADVYEIAEQCCESGKKKAHKEGSLNKYFIIFHYCHSGITNSPDAIRERQEADHTSRPYEYSTSWKEFMQLGSRIAEEKDIKLDRSDLKDISRAIAQGNPYYQEQLKRIASRQKTDDFKKEIISGGSKTMKMLYDISIVYDLYYVIFISTKRKKRMMRSINTALKTKKVPEEIFYFKDVNSPDSKRKGYVHKVERFISQGNSK